MFTESIVCAHCGVLTEKVRDGFRDETGSLMCDEPQPLPHVWLDPNEPVGRKPVITQAAVPYGEEFHAWIAGLHESYAEVVTAGAVGDVNVDIEYDSDNVTIYLTGHRPLNTEEQIQAAQEKLIKARQIRAQDMVRIAQFRKMYPQEFPPVIEDDPLTAALTAPPREN